MSDSGNSERRESDRENYRRRNFGSFGEDTEERALQPLNPTTLLRTVRRPLTQEEEEQQRVWWRNIGRPLEERITFPQPQQQQQHPQEPQEQPQSPRQQQQQRPATGAPPGPRIARAQEEVYTAGEREAMRHLLALGQHTPIDASRTGTRRVDGTNRTTAIHRVPDFRPTMPPRAIFRTSPTSPRTAVIPRRMLETTPTRRLSGVGASEAPDSSGNELETGDDE